MKSSSSACPLQKEEGLNRTIRVWGLSANIVNIVVGAGIFVLSAILATYSIFILSNRITKAD
ncbi:hypothetical protein [Rhodohalobacter sp. 8-1]|uniref:hypothetical protein n=1 Tax=Rhodohalobacter sp. 8-1 TaxID=3131972 RepID=UPI0030ED6838